MEDDLSCADCARAHDAWACTDSPPPDGGNDTPSTGKVDGSYCEGPVAPRGFRTCKDGGVVREEACVEGQT